MEPDDVHSASLRRIVVRAVLVVLPLIGLALAAPRLVQWSKRDRTGGLGVLEVEGGPERPFDRPPTDEELRAAAAADEKLARAEGAWKNSTAIAPSEATADASGENVRWFEGFGISVESTPAGAQVLVDGQDLGQTPIVSSLACQPGDEIRVEVRKPPRRPQARTTRCRKDQLVELRFELK